MNGEAILDCDHARSEVRDSKNTTFKWPISEDIEKSFEVKLSLLKVRLSRKPSFQFVRISILI
jgi:hypothetical protein